MRLFHILPFLLGLFLGACATTTQPKSKPGMSAYCADQGKAIIGNRYYEDAVGRQVRMTKSGENMLDAMIGQIANYNRNTNPIEFCKVIDGEGGVGLLVRNAQVTVTPALREHYAPKLLTFLAHDSYGENKEGCLSNERLLVAQRALNYFLAKQRGCELPETPTAPRLVGVGRNLANLQ